MLAGILVDVSGSMKSSLQLHANLSDQQITRAQSIFTIIMNIVDREVSFSDDHDVFVLAFGLEDVSTCDLLALLQYIQTLELKIDGNGHENLLLLLTSLGISGLNTYVRTHMTEREAQFLFYLYSERRNELREIAEQFSFSTSDCCTYTNGQTALIELLASRRVTIAAKYVKEHVSEEQAQYLFKFYSREKEQLLEFVEQFVFSNEDRFHHGDAQNALIGLLASNGAPNTEKYVRKYVSEEQAEFLFKFYSTHTREMHHVVQHLPAICKTKPIKSQSSFRNGLWGGLMGRMRATAFDQGIQAHNQTDLYLYIKEKGSHFGICDGADATEQKAVEEQVTRAMERAYRAASRHVAELMNEHINHSIRTFKRLIRRPIVEILTPMGRSKSKTFKSTVNLIKQIADKSSDPSTTQRTLTSTQLSVLADSIEPFIYGGTPMCKSLRSALDNFCSSKHPEKFLFLLSDGESGDGNPTDYAQKFRDAKVLVFACFLTSENITHRRRLYYEPDPNWSKAHRDMFELSGTVENSHSAMSILLQQNWELPSSGHSRLFIQANHSDVIEEFSSVIHYMSESNEVLLNMVGRVSLDIYINACNAEFEAKNQGIERTCYAYAVATVFHLAMRRIEGRENGVPKFEDVCQELINEFGKNTANTADILEACAPRYRLHSKQVNEIGARQAINHRRPVVATFGLSEEQWTSFESFYASHPNGILENKDLCLAKVGTKLIKHAVVLIKCDPTYLTFINSWGSQFADKGFFRVQNQSVLNLKFYDVYWNENELKESEVQAFKKKSVEKGRNLMQRLPLGIQNLLYQCPQCCNRLPVNTFIIHFSDLECPKCHQNFKTTPMGLDVAMYSC